AQAAIGELQRQSAEPRQQAQQAQLAGCPEIIRRLGEAKDIGKPPDFKNEKARFSEWLQKLNGHVLSISGVSFEAVDDEKIESVDEKLSQLYALFTSPMEGESFDLVMSAGQGCGSLALRLLVRRRGPTSGGRRRVLREKIMALNRAEKLVNLAGEIAAWEEFIGRRERRRADDRDVRLDDEIKMSALESLLPRDVELHLALNRAGLNDCASTRKEARGFLETRRAWGALGRARGYPVEMGAFVKGHPKGKGGKGKGRDHKASERWNPKQAKRKPKGKDRAEKGRGGHNQRHGEGVRTDYLNNSEETGSTTSTQLPAPASQAGQSASLSFDAFARIAELNSVEVQPDNKRCRKSIAMRLDIGAAATALPLSQEGERADRDWTSHRAAAGETVEDKSGVTSKGASECGEQMNLQGRRANASEPPLSASATASKGYVTWIGAFGGYVLKDSEFTEKIHQMIDNRAAGRVLQD
ncbi:unnamed protein product, partial [Prorocentrum cordatum]